MNDETGQYYEDAVRDLAAAEARMVALTEALQEICNSLGTQEEGYSDLEAKAYEIARDALAQAERMVPS